MYVLLFFSWVTVNVFQHAVNYYRKYEIECCQCRGSSAQIRHLFEFCALYLKAYSILVTLLNKKIKLVLEINLHWLAISCLEDNLHCMHNSYFSLLDNFI